jgi:hypothetical protein
VGLINGKEQSRIDFEYGYSDMYLQRTIEELNKKGWKIQDHWLYSWCKDNGIEYHNTVSDVSRKRDL